MNKQIEEMANIIAFKAFEQAHLENGDDNLADIVAIELYDKGYRRQEDVAKEIFEELSTEIMPLVENHNRIAEKTGDREWGYRADGLETVLIALKVILKKYGVTEDEY